MGIIELIFTFATDFIMPIFVAFLAFFVSAVWLAKRAAVHHMHRYYGGGHPSRANGFAMAFGAALFATCGTPLFWYMHAVAMAATGSMMIGIIATIVSVVALMFWVVALHEWHKDVRPIRGFYRFSL